MARLTTKIIVYVLVPDLPASVSKRRVASLWHVVGVWSATGRKLPGANGRGGSRGRGGV